ncbi:hypothetical protein L207DRAFT_183922 [Hyaloscypha variabilis F]|uniref:Uncharacterized protein n=1 Tax=Hyaloscypha variabilis (strain UAMH 11265 / GT02V1 / F) TaxID=1149755 RepID=A0A2J6R0S1_HYAVF|nr:hypothetical protein L207DRAFT_183922 [Hyaloscypha variabilis F]
MGAIGISLNQLNSIGNVKVLRLSLTCIRKEERAAVKVILDVCSRIFKVNMMVNDTSGKTAMITRRPRIDFGKRIKDAVKVLQDSCSEEHVMAGTMG